MNYRVYCDESCHLENDGEPAMVLGAVWCPEERVKEATVRLREIKAHHGLPSTFEVKWTKASPGKIDLYLDLVDYFLDDDHLSFRAVVIPDKSKLDHGKFGQTHDEWYYKMYFSLLNHILSPADAYRIFLDVKDTRGASKLRKLQDVLRNANYDWRGDVVQSIQGVRSEEVALLQLADLLIGSVSYANRFPARETSKRLLVDRIKKRTGYSLVRSTLPRESKFNVFVWRAAE